MKPTDVVATTCPRALVERSELVTPVILRFVVVAVPYTVRPPDVVPLPIVVEAWEMRPLWNVWRAVQVLALPVLRASVLLENVSVEPMVAEVTGPVPLPVRMPPRVVEPVPPKFTESEEELITCPAELVVRRALARPVMMRFVVEAVPFTVRPPLVVPSPMVVEAAAMIPPVN